MAPNAFVTMLTSDSYLPGALVSAHSIKQSQQFDQEQDFDLVCLITLGSVAVQSIKALRKVFNLVISVEEIRSSSRDELNLLGRQDLSGTITKIHVWRLIQYQKIIYLDADTLILKPISHLFQLPHPFSACPDTGWPDCFNSGLMVIQPSLDVFDQLYGFFMESGSWDGGDQGLLNDFFGQQGELTGGAVRPPAWNRLSFTYNVTPSAYYTYAPAYKRFGDKISVIHFIGQVKPWHLRNQRLFQTRLHPDSSNTLPTIDYDTLVSKWFDVYERAYGPVNSNDDIAMKQDFNFPHYAAEWDSRRPSRYEPPSVEKLKEMFTRGSGNTLNSGPLLQHDDIHAGDDEGRYMSMPLPGQPYLSLNQHGFQAWDFKEKETQASDTCQLGIQPPIDKNLFASPGPARDLLPPEDTPQQETTTSYHHHRQKGQQDHQYSIWDASRSSPPDRGFQMANPITTYYKAAWDQPVSQQSSQFFQPPPQPQGFIPPITHQDYSQVASNSPSLEHVKCVFPWEQSTSDSTMAQRTYRVFPEEEVKVPDRETRVRERSYNSDAFSDDAHLQKEHPSIHKANLSEIYRNAWDAHPFIRRYAGALSGSSSHHHSRGVHNKKTAEARQFFADHLARTPRLERKSFFGGHHHQFENHHAGRFRSSGDSDTFRTRRDSETSSRYGDEEDEGSDVSQAPKSKGSSSSRLGSKNDLMVPANANELPDEPKALSALTTTKEAAESNVGLGGRRPQSFGRNELVGSSSRIPTMRSIIIGVPLGAGEGADEKVGTGTKSSKPGDVMASTENETTPRLEGGGGGGGGGPRASKPSRVFSASTDTGSFKQSGLSALQKLVTDMENQKRVAAVAAAAAAAGRSERPSD